VPWIFEIPETIYRSLSPEWAFKPNLLALNGPKTNKQTNGKEWWYQTHIEILEIMDHLSESCGDSCEGVERGVPVHWINHVDRRRSPWLTLERQSRHGVAYSLDDHAPGTREHPPRRLHRDLYAAGDQRRQGHRRQARRSDIWPQPLVKSREKDILENEELLRKNCGHWRLFVLLSSFSYFFWLRMLD